MRSINPALNKKTFRQPLEQTSSGVMTIQGTATKTLVLLAILVVCASFTWTITREDEMFSRFYPWLLASSLGGLAVAVVTVINKRWAPVTAPIYAALEGLFLGAVSKAFELWYPGIVPQAVGLTFGILFALLLAYKSRIIKPTQNFRLGVVAATFGVLLLYLVTFALRLLFGIEVPFIHDSGPIGIGISVVIVIIAALNLVLDFDFIESGAAMGAPKYMEWYGAFGLMVTLVWLYLEILRLLSKIRRR